jgi:hypothetical protein
VFGSRALLDEVAMFLKPLCFLFGYRVKQNGAAPSCVWF